MARGELLVPLVHAAATGNRETVKSTAEALAADERAKKHHGVADRIERALSAVSVTPPSLVQLGVAWTGNQGRDAIIEISPRRRLQGLVLPLPVRENARSRRAEGEAWGTPSQ